MTFYPGSHRLGEVEIQGVGSVMDRPMSGTDLRRAGLDPAGAVDLVLDPGDVALWNLYTIHGSRPNRATIDRRLYLNGYVPAAQCDRREWAFRDGTPCPPREPALGPYQAPTTPPE